MTENITAYLEKVWTEYSEYKEFIKSISKPIEELRKEVAQKITQETTAEQAQKLFFEGFEKIMLHNGDFIYQQNRLFYTVEAYKNIIEIPQEIKTEVENIKFTQIFKIKNNTEVVVSEEVVNQARENLKKALETNMEMVTKFFS